jgi:AcrR family transcriptional regulator
MSDSELSAKTLQTRRLLTEHLKSMLEEQNFRRITVNDICQRAMISRSTFYLHFDDKYSLLRYCLELEMSQWEQASAELDFHNYLIYVLNDILSKKNFYENTLVYANDHELHEIFFTVFSNFFTMKLEQIIDQKQVLPCPVSIISAFYVGGITCSIIQWIKKDFYIPVADMARYQEELLYSTSMSEAIPQQDSNLHNSESC